jgi:hypothetical protein
LQRGTVLGAESKGTADHLTCDEQNRESGDTAEDPKGDRLRLYGPFGFCLVRSATVFSYASAGSQ